MPVNTVELPFFTFIGGLNSEAGPFTFPPNTWAEGNNIVPDLSGALFKRKAIDLELGYTTSNINISNDVVLNSAFTVREWNAVNGNGNINFIVVQVGYKLYFYENRTTALSLNIKNFSIDLDAYYVGGNPNGKGFSQIDVSSVYGKLLVVSQDTKPIFITYNSTTDSITVEEVEVKIRDLQGIDDGLAVNERPPTLSNQHKYNLYNQGWYESYINTVGSPYPSNAQSWIHGKDSSDVFTKTQLEKMDFGTTPAPKGRFILDAFHRDRSLVSGVSGIDEEIELFRPSTTAFYAGRAWYSGVNSNKLGTWVFFSQVVESEDKIGNCFQEADPTSEIISDLVDSDGGIIIVADAGTIVSLKAISAGVVVFATNGIWFIGAGQDSKFSASSYEVRKISNVGTQYANSIVAVEDLLFYWSAGGINVLTADPVSGMLQSQSLTDTTIKTMYNEIPSTGKLYCSGKYNTEGKIIYWIYNSDSNNNGIENRFVKDSILAYDFRIKCFYTLSFATKGIVGPYIVDSTLTKDVFDLIEDVLVYDSGNNQVAVGTDEVVVQMRFASGAPRAWKFLTLVPDGNVWEMTFSDFETTRNAPDKFRDFFSWDNNGASYDAYIITGYSISPGNGNKAIQALYVHTYLYRTETGFTNTYEPVNGSACYLQARWDFTDDTVANKWSQEQQVYRHLRPYIVNAYTDPFNDGYPVIITKNKVRGRGKAVQLKLTAHPDKDMQIVGWTGIFLGNTNV